MDGIGSDQRHRGLRRAADTREPCSVRCLDVLGFRAVRATRHRAPSTHHCHVSSGAGAAVPEDVGLMTGVPQIAAELLHCQNCKAGLIRAPASTRTIDFRAQEPPRTASATVPMPEGAAVILYDVFGVPLWSICPILPDRCSSDSPT